MSLATFLGTSGLTATFDHLQDRDCDDDAAATNEPTGAERQHNPGLWARRCGGSHDFGDLRSAANGSDRGCFTTIFVADDARPPFLAYFGGLVAGVTERDLAAAMAPLRGASHAAADGDVTAPSGVVGTPEIHRCEGYAYAFVEFATRQQLSDAMLVSGTRFQGKLLKVSVASERQRLNYQRTQRRSRINVERTNNIDEAEAGPSKMTMVSREDFGNAVAGSQAASTAHELLRRGGPLLCGGLRKGEGGDGASTSSSSSRATSVGSLRSTVGHRTAGATTPRPQDEPAHQQDEVAKLSVEHASSTQQQCGDAPTGAQDAVPSGLPTDCPYFQVWSGQVVVTCWQFDCIEAGTCDCSERPRTAPAAGDSPQQLGDGATPPCEPAVPGAEARSDGEAEQRSSRHHHRHRQQSTARHTEADDARASEIKPPTTSAWNLPTSTVQQSPQYVASPSVRHALASADRAAAPTSRAPQLCAASAGDLASEPAAVFTVAAGGEAARRLRVQHPAVPAGCSLLRCARCYWPVCEHAATTR